MNEMEVLYSAVASAHGLVIKASNFDIARARLYATRKKLGDQVLDALQIRRGPNDEIWIINQGKAVEAPTSNQLDVADLC